MRGNASSAMLAFALVIGTVPTQSFGFGLTSLLAPSVLSQIEFEIEEVGGQPVIQEQEQQEANPAQQKKDPVAEYKKAIQGLELADGPLKIYKRKNEMLLEVREEDLGKLFYAQVMVAKGFFPTGFDPGTPINSTSDFSVETFYWERDGDNLKLMKPRLDYRFKSDDPFATAIERSFPLAILGTFKIEQQNPDAKLLLVNFTPFFTGDLFGVNRMMSRTPYGSYVRDQANQHLYPKGFPENTIVTAQMHFVLNGPANNTPPQITDPRSLPIELTFNLWTPKQSDYVPRLSDPRIGYFTRDFVDAARFLEEDRTQSYILRFDLRKKDPSAALSEPVKPITFVLDNSIPEKYKPAVRKAVLAWLPAFEAIGFKNALVVKDSKEIADYHHADGRYNVIRWTMSEGAEGFVAIALFRSDPFTGEILNACVNMDANWLALAVRQYESVYPQSAASISLEDLQDLSPRRLRALSMTPMEYLSMSPEKRARADATLDWKRTHGSHSHSDCCFGEGLAKQAGHAWQAMELLGNSQVPREEFIDQLIVSVLIHEVGHCLGLRHNFAASTYLTNAQLADESVVSREGIAASIMDYTPPNVHAVLRGKGTFFSGNIGIYDRWAIRYGYTPFGADTPSAETDQLKTITRESGRPGLRYMTDENRAYGLDPFVEVWDNASDSLNYFEEQLKLSDRLMEYALKKLPRPGEDFRKRTNYILSAVNARFQLSGKASWYLQGVQLSRSRYGDLDARPAIQPLDPELPRQAMRIISKYALSPEAVEIPKEVVFNLGTSVERAPDWSAPLRTFYGNGPKSCVAAALNLEVAQGIMEDSYKHRLAGHKTPYTLTEHYGLVLGKTFSEIGQNRSISPTRRDLQRLTLSILMSYAMAPSDNKIPDEPRFLSREALVRLEKRYEAQLQASANLDQDSQIYLRSCHAAIKKFLNGQQNMQGIP